MIDKDKILAKIKLIYDKNETYPKKDKDLVNFCMYRGRKQVLNMLLNFINSFPAEQPSERLGDEIDHFRCSDIFALAKRAGEEVTATAQHFAQWQKEQTINKASKWLAGNVINYIWCSKGGGLGISDEFFIDFKKAMENE